jgi:hypothetical protein
LHYIIIADKHWLRRCALDALKGVGDRECAQWEDWSGYAYHVKRRLTPEEQEYVGEALDIRGTEEAIKRHAAVMRFLPPELRNWRE